MNQYAIQTLLDQMMEDARKERAESQMTLGKLIERLEEMPKDALVANITNAHSYRGYYSDLAFEPSTPGQTRSAKSLLKDCYDVLGSTLEGYKGGDFTMSRSTPVWISYYGQTGDKLMAITDDGVLIIQDDD